MITRFAPSTTGDLHIGNIWIALNCFIYSQKHNGVMFLRIDDLYKKKIDSTKILKILYWLKIQVKKIVIQKKRIFFYQHILLYLLLIRRVFLCNCKKRRLFKLKLFLLFWQLDYSYDKFCYNNFKKSKKKYVYRYIPIEKTLKFYDINYGILNFKYKINNYILKTTTNKYTYNFCSVVDDILLKITHIIRGSDHLNNINIQNNLFTSLRTTVPKWFHFPLLMDSSRKKISKKKVHFKVISYIYNYLPSAFYKFFIEFHDFFNKKITSHIIFDEKKLLYCNSFCIKKIPLTSLILRWKNFSAGVDIICLSSHIRSRVNLLTQIEDFIYLKINYLPKWNLNKFFKQKYKKILKVIFNLINLTKWLYNLIKFNINKDTVKILMWILSNRAHSISIFFMICIIKKNITVWRLTCWIRYQNIYLTLMNVFKSITYIFTILRKNVTLFIKSTIILK